MSGVFEAEDLSDLTRDSYAHFGLAYFDAEALFEGLVQVVATAGDGVTHGTIEERTKRLRAGTFGPLVNEAKAVLPTEHHLELDRAVERRNDLAHGFWFGHVHLTTTKDGLKQLIEGFEADQALFRRLNALTDAIMMPRMKARGMTEGLWEELMKPCNAVPPDPDMSRALPKRGAQLRIRSAWSITPGGLVFQDDAGEFWQPSDLGLGWYVGSGVAPHWKPVFPELLPATVVARPKEAKSWDYVVEFSTGLQLRACIDATSKTPSVRAVRPSSIRKASQP